MAGNVPIAGPGGRRHFPGMAGEKRQYEISLERIEQRLEALGLSAFAASKRAGSPDLIRDLKRGKSHMMRIDNLERLAEVLDCDTAYLTRDQDTPRTAQTEAIGQAEPGTASIALSFDEVALVGMFRAASDGERAQMLAVLRAMLARPNTDGGKIPGVDSRGRSVTDKAS
jgi:transcriptional regulator with XRE-family HTH domain